MSDTAKIAGVTYTVVDSYRSAAVGKVNWLLRHPDGSHHSACAKRLAWNTRLSPVEDISAWQARATAVRNQNRAPRFLGQPLN